MVSSVSLLKRLLCGFGVLLAACSKDAAPPCQCSADEVCVAGACGPLGTPVVEVAIGSEPGQLGVTLPEEAADLAPMSLAARSDGKVWVLDQENRRLQLFDGNRAEQVLSLDSGTYQDLALLDDGKLVVMTRRGEGELVVLDASGRVEQRVRLRGPRIDHAGSAGHLARRSDGVWVTYLNRMVRVLDTRGAADPERPMVRGQLSLDLQSVTSYQFRSDQLYVIKRNRTGPMQKLEVTHTLPRSISNITEAHSDAAGNLYLLIDHLSNDGPITRVLLVLGPTLEIVRETDVGLEPSSPGGEIFRELDVLPNGNVFLLRVAESDVKVRRF